MTRDKIDEENEKMLKLAAQLDKPMKFSVRKNIGRHLVNKQNQLLKMLGERSRDAQIKAWEDATTLIFDARTTRALRPHLTSFLKGVPLTTADAELGTILRNLERKKR